MFLRLVQDTLDLVEHFDDQGLRNLNEWQIYKVIALHFSINIMCRAIALQIYPWLDRIQIQLYINIIGLWWLYMNLRFELVFTAIQMGSDDNWNDVVMYHKLVKSTCYIKTDLALLMVEMPT